MSESLRLPEPGEVAIVDNPPNYDRVLLRRRKTPVQSVKLRFQPKEWNEERREYQVKNNIYKVTVGVGSRPIYLITKTKVTLPRGSQFLPLSPITEAPDIIIDNETARIIANSCGINANNWTTLFQHHLDHINDSPIFFELIPLISENGRNEIKRWDFELLERDYFYEGMEKDDNIMYIYRAQPINFSDNPFKEEETCINIQPYNSHSIIVAPTKRSKSWTASKIGTLYTEVKSARMLGYATADSVYQGDANGSIDPIACDNVHNYKSGVLAGMLELMETGETRVGKGSEAVHTRTLSAFILHANPPKTKTRAVLAASFEQLINLVSITIGTGAFGSRVAIINFDSEAERAEGNPLPMETAKKNKIIFEFIIDEVNKEVQENIFPRFREWLNRGIEDYKRDIENFLGRSTLSDGIKEFWLDHGEGAYRHIRGMALKEAIMDNLKKIWLRNYTIEQILESADENLERIRNINLVSLQSIVETIDHIPFDDWVKGKFDRLRHNSEKALVLAVVSYVVNHQRMVYRGMFVPLNQIGEYYNRLPDNIKLSGYRYLSRVYIPTNLDKLNRTLDFGFKFSKMVNVTIVRLEHTREILALARKLRIMLSV